MKITDDLWRCRLCGQAKAPSEFYVSRTPNKQSYACRECVRSQQREQYAKDAKYRERVRQRGEARRLGLASHTIGRPKVVHPKREAPDESWRCVKCGEEKPATAFYLHRDPRKQNYVCRACIRRQESARYQSDPDYRARVIARTQARYAADPEARRREAREFYAKHKDRWLVYTDENRDKIARYRWIRTLRNDHGMTVEEYEEMLNAQDGLCAICQRPNGAKRPLHVDHDHANGERRGLLCHGCNTGLGGLGDSIPRLEAAIAYLRRFEP